MRTGFNMVSTRNNTTMFRISCCGCAVCSTGGPGSTPCNCVTHAGFSFTNRTGQKTNCMHCVRTSEMLVETSTAKKVAPRNVFGSLSHSFHGNVLSVSLGDKGFGHPRNSN